MIELVLQTPQVHRFHTTLFEGNTEGCVALLTRPVKRGNLQRLLSVDVVVPDSHAYLKRDVFEAQLSPEFIAPLAKRAIREKLGLVFVHSHPGRHPPTFSAIDDKGEEHLADFLVRREVTLPHAAMVVSRGGVAARLLGKKEPIRVVEVGSARRVLYEPREEDGTPLGPEFDRQVRALGDDGQKKLQSLKVAVVGLGGTGSVVVQQLAHLGVRSFLLVDPDVVEATNLNRLVGATPGDIGLPKTEVAKRNIKGLCETARVRTQVADIMRAIVARDIAEVDFVFACTDSHGSRAVLQQVAYQYLVPTIDMGSTIVTRDGQVSHALGRIQMLAPGLPCLTCSKLLDSSEVRTDMMTPLERRADPYVVGSRVPAPAVISLNSTVASIAVTMFLDAITGFGGKPRHLLYNFLVPALRIVRIDADPTCFVCSKVGALARGDDADLMARQD